MTLPILLLSACSLFTTGASRQGDPAECRADPDTYNVDTNELQWVNDEAQFSCSEAGCDPSQIVSAEYAICVSGFRDGWPWFDPWRGANPVWVVEHWVGGGRGRPSRFEYAEIDAISGEVLLWQSTRSGRRGGGVVVDPPPGDTFCCVGR